MTDALHRFKTQTFNEKKIWLQEKKKAKYKYISGNRELFSLFHWPRSRHYWVIFHECHLVENQLFRRHLVCLKSIVNYSDIFFLQHTWRCCSVFRISFLTSITKSHNNDSNQKNAKNGNSKYDPCYWWRFKKWIWFGICYKKKKKIVEKVEIVWYTIMNGILTNLFTTFKIITWFSHGNTTLLIVLTFTNILKYSEKKNLFFFRILFCSRFTWFLSFVCLQWRWNWSPHDAIYDVFRQTALIDRHWSPHIT